MEDLQVTPWAHMLYLLVCLPVIKKTFTRAFVHSVLKVKQIIWSCNYILMLCVLSSMSSSNQVKQGMCVVGILCCYEFESEANLLSVYASKQYVTVTTL